MYHISTFETKALEHSYNVFVALTIRLFSNIFGYFQNFICKQSHQIRESVFPFSFSRKYAFHAKRFKKYLTGLYKIFTRKEHLQKWDTQAEAITKDCNIVSFHFHSHFIIKNCRVSFIRTSCAFTYTKHFGIVDKWLHSSDVYWNTAWSANCKRGQLLFHSFLSSLQRISNA